MANAPKTTGELFEAKAMTEVEVAAAADAFVAAPSTTAFPSCRLLDDASRKAEDGASGLIWLLRPFQRGERSRQKRYLTFRRIISHSTP